MRKSSERHPLAVLRRIIELDQPAFAHEVGLSISTVSKIETMKLPLSLENAMLIASETGCSPVWLLMGNPMAPPLAGIPDPKAPGRKTGKGKFEPPPYTKEIFDHVRSSLKAGNPIKGADYMDISLFSDPLQLIIRALHRASKTNRSSLAYSKLSDLAKEFTKAVGITDPLTPDFAEYQDKLLSSIVELTEIDRPQH
jgi:transcriptional regulator with XRE-family HTH domain